MHKTNVLPSRSVAMSEAALATDKRCRTCTTLFPHDLLVTLAKLDTNCYPFDFHILAANGNYHLFKKQLENVHFMLIYIMFLFFSYPLRYFANFAYYG